MTLCLAVDMGTIKHWSHSLNCSPWKGPSRREVPDSHENMEEACEASRYPSISPLHNECRKQLNSNDCRTGEKMTSKYEYRNPSRNPSVRTSCSNDCRTHKKMTSKYEYRNPSRSPSPRTSCSKEGKNSDDGHLAIQKSHLYGNHVAHRSQPQQSSSQEHCSSPQHGNPDHFESSEDYQMYIKHIGGMRSRDFHQRYELLKKRVQHSTSSLKHGSSEDDNRKSHFTSKQDQKPSEQQFEQFKFFQTIEEKERDLPHSQRPNSSSSGDNINRYCPEPDNDSLQVTERNRYVHRQKSCSAKCPRNDYAYENKPHIKDSQNFSNGHLSEIHEIICGKICKLIHRDDANHIMHQSQT